MKKIFCILFLLIASVVQGQNAGVKKTIETFFEGFHTRDTVIIKSVCGDKMILQSIAEVLKGNKFSNESSKEFYISIAKIPKDVVVEEKILSYNIQVDGTMAHVWTPYEFYMNGKLSHYGVNAFTLFKENEKWKIIYVIDTRRK